MLPAAASLQKQGANRGAVASFLVSTPESGIDSIAITYALLDPIMTVARPVAAFFTGMSAGILENSISFPKITSDHLLNGSIKISPEKRAVQPPIQVQARVIDFKRIAEGLRYGCTDIWGSIVFWFFGGLLVAGIITVVIPEEITELVLGGGLVSMVAMLILGMPLYICATASTPIAAAFLLNGASPGAVLVFLLAGPATNMTSLSVLIKLLGKAGTVRYFLVIVFCSLLFGIAVDWIYYLFEIEPKMLVSQMRETIPYSVKIVSTIVLLCLSLYQMVLQIKKFPYRSKDNFYLTGFPDLHPVKQNHLPDQQARKNRARNSDHQ